MNGRTTVAIIAPATAADNSRLYAVAIATPIIALVLVIIALIIFKVKTGKGNEEKPENIKES